MSDDIQNNTVITVGGNIGDGKASLTNLLAEDDNDILPLFYTASPEEQEMKRYPPLLRLEFLNSPLSKRHYVQTKILSWTALFMTIGILPRSILTSVK